VAGLPAHRRFDLIAIAGFLGIIYPAQRVIFVFSWSKLLRRIEG